MTSLSIRGIANSSLPTLAMLAAALMNITAAPGQAKPKSVQAPSLTLTLTVFQPDGHTLQTYNTTKGLSFWTSELPVLRDDQVKIDVTADTDRAGLKELIVRLDNGKLADVTASSWSTVINTTTVPVGYHMIEVWAQSAGDPKTAGTRMQEFYIAPEAQAQYKVQGIIQQMADGTVTTQETESDPGTPPLPAPLRDKTTDAGAGVVLSYRAVTESGAGLLVGDSPIIIADPMDFSVTAPPGSAAARFVYALSRGGRVVNEIETPVPLDTPADRRALRIRKHTDTDAGLNSGPITLWVWGVDKNGQPGNPARAMLDIP